MAMRYRRRIASARVRSLEFVAFRIVHGGVPSVRCRPERAVRVFVCVRTRVSETMRCKPGSIGIGSGNSEQRWQQHQMQRGQQREAPADSVAGPLFPRCLSSSRRTAWPGGARRGRGKLQEVDGKDEGPKQGGGHGGKRDQEGEGLPAMLRFSCYSIKLLMSLL
ncbi:hypothetical protein PUN28_016022 [Cardiocondyla obscurior]|uniref:Uncharacterized protein n=1 Tax=Cardiocondyla obscurior TaxID=286306 RepID=A0AAW2EQM0_9HYME